MTQTAMTYADLMRTHAIFRAYATNFADCPFISLNALWELGGCVADAEPVAWLARRDDYNFGQARAFGGYVAADEHATWEYLLNTQPEVVAVALAENGREIAADPVRCVLYCPSAAIVGIALKHLARAQGVATAQVSEAFMTDVLARTAEYSELRRETIVSQIRRAIRQSESPGDGSSIRDPSGSNLDLDIAGMIAGLHPWYIPKPDLTVRSLIGELDLNRSMHRHGDLSHRAG